MLWRCIVTHPFLAPFLCVPLISFHYVVFSSHLPTFPAPLPLLSSFPLSSPFLSSSVPFLFSYLILSSPLFYSSSPPFSVFSCSRWVGGTNKAPSNHWTRVQADAEHPILTRPSFRGLVHLQGGGLQVRCLRRHAGCRFGSEGWESQQGRASYPSWSASLPELQNLWWRTDWARALFCTHVWKNAEVASPPRLMGWNSEVCGKNSDEGRSLGLDWARPTFCVMTRL